MSNGLEPEHAWSSGVGLWGRVGWRGAGQKLRVARVRGALAGPWFHAFPQCLSRFASKTCPWIVLTWSCPQTFLAGVLKCRPPGYLLFCSHLSLATAAVLSTRLRAFRS